jgi:uncharacterized protein YjdB
VASIDQNGLLTATAVGSITVVATASDGSGVTASFEIDITPILVSEIIVSIAEGQEEIINIEGTLQLEAQVLPANATDATFLWSVENGEGENGGEATIDESGVLTAVSAGVVTVVATANDGSGIEGRLEIVIEAIVSAINDDDLVDITIFPNPAYHFIRVNTSSSTLSRIDIIDMQGRLVLSTDQPKNEINIRSLRNAIYLIRATTTQGKIHLTRIIKQ